MFLWLKIFLLGVVSITFSLGGEDYREVTRKSYDKTAHEYEKNTLKLQPEVKAKAFLSYLAPHSKILDLGCGPGRDAKFFISKGYQVPNRISFWISASVKAPAVERSYVVQY